MKTYLRRLAAACLALALTAGLAAAQVSNPSQSANSGGCVLAGCNLSYSQNGVQSFVRTYKYSSLGNVPAATQTDLFTIAGSASKTIRVTKIVIGGANSAGQVYRGVQIIRRSAVDSGGTPSNPAALARDTQNAAATATLTLFTAAPSGLGTTVGTLDSCRLIFVQTATTFSTPDVCAFTYGVNDDQLTVLRGATDVLAINFLGATAGVTATATTDFIDIDVEWTEEP